MASSPSHRDIGLAGARAFWAYHPAAAASLPHPIGTKKYVAKFDRFTRLNKVYWIMPLVVILGLMALLIVASQTAALFIDAVFSRSWLLALT